MSTSTDRFGLHHAAAAVLTATAGLALWAAAPGFTFDEVNEKPAPLGIVGIAVGQTLRISVANVVGFDPQPDPPSCRLKVGFVDGQGRTYGAPDTFELRPGAARSFDHVAIGNPHIRSYVRPVVADMSSGGTCPAVVTGELLDREAGAIIIYDSQLVNPRAFSGKI